jgi:hypothetical protein
MTGQDDAWQEAMSPHLMAISHRMVQGAGKPIHINPHVGRLSSQVKQRREATSPRTIPGIIHLNVKNARELRKTPVSPEEHHGSSVHPVQTDLLNLGPHWPYNLLPNVKVTSP